MIRSMTGYGKSTGIYGSNNITVEIRSLNSKFLELNLRLPSVYKDREMELRNELTRAIERGKADISILIESAPGAKKSSLNNEVITQYFTDLLALKNECGLSTDDYMNVIMRLPNVVNTDKSEADDAEWEFISNLVPMH